VLKDTEQTIGHGVEQSTNPFTSPKLQLQLRWESIDWKKAEQHVKRLQERIYRATKGQQWAKVRNLQKLLARSYDNKLLAIREITDRNKGKKTAGIDNKVYLTPAERWNLSLEEFHYQSWRPAPVKRVWTPKSDGTRRPLGIPTIKDRIMQSIIKTALEPEWEARFEPHSYGFRPGRNTMDAIAEIRNRIGWSQTHAWILDADISKCFDNITHEPLLQQIPVFKTIIHRWLKAGVVELELGNKNKNKNKNNNYISPTSGTPQGGVISPLLANIALTGLERLFTENGQKVKIHVIRYADDFVVISPSRTIIERHVLPKLTKFLSQRGLSLNLMKTRIVHRTEGFSFLGFTIRYFEQRQGSRLLITPTKQNISKVLQNIKAIFRHSQSLPLQKVIPKLNKVIRGWTNYYRFVNAKRSFSLLNHRIFKIVWSGLKRLHPQKSVDWLRHRYFLKDTRQEWQLVVEENGSKSILMNPIYVRIRRYTKVRDYSSPYDPSQRAYWKERSSTVYSLQSTGMMSTT